MKLTIEKEFAKKIERALLIILVYVLCIFSAAPALLQTLLFLKTGIIQEIKTIDFFECYLWSNTLIELYKTDWVLLDDLFKNILNTNCAIIAPIISFSIIGFIAQNSRQNASARRTKRVYKDYNGGKRIYRNRIYRTCRFKQYT